MRRTVQNIKNTFTDDEKKLLDLLLQSIPPAELISLRDAGPGHRIRPESMIPSLHKKLFDNTTFLTVDETIVLHEVLSIYIELPGPARSESVVRLEGSLRTHLLSLGVEYLPSNAFGDTFPTSRCND